MKERRVLVKAFSRAYGKAVKKEKGKILQRFVEATGYSRRYGARLLRLSGVRLRMGGVRLEGDPQVRTRRRRGRVYGREVQEELKRLWVMMDYVCGKRLAPALAGLLEALERHGELKMSAQVRAQLERISAATIDRLLAGEKRRLRLKGRGGTKPGTLLRHQIPIRTFEDWDEKRPGFAEVDLVAHEGGQARGDYAQTLDLTDVATGWTELVAVLNKAQVWVFEALGRARERLPFPLLGLDSDNGAELINNQLRRFCEREQITFTRSRPYRKNDNCFVEQKNYTLVRRFVGYRRYQGAPAVELLNQLYQVLSLYVNFFVPSLQLKEKIREGSRVRKRHHPARTPYERVLRSREISRASKAKLRRLQRSLNPAQLHRRILALQERLLRLPGRESKARVVDAAAPDGKDQAFSTGARKTPAEFPTAPTTPAAGDP